jgi:hypothetical protein
MSDIQHYISLHEWHRKCANAPYTLLLRAKKKLGDPINKEVICPICLGDHDLPLTIKKKKIICPKCSHAFDFFEVYYQLYERFESNQELMELLGFKVMSPKTSRVTITISNTNKEFIESLEIPNLSSYINSLIDKARVKSYRKNKSTSIKID